MLSGKNVKTFLILFARPNGSIGHHKISYNFCRTILVSFRQFVWIEKKGVTIIVAFHVMKRRLKIKFKSIIILGCRSAEISQNIKKAIVWNN